MFYKFKKSGYIINLNHVIDVVPSEKGLAVITLAHREGTVTIGDKEDSEHFFNFLSDLSS
jgi:hypothetical protein